MDYARSICQTYKGRAQKHGLPFFKVSNKNQERTPNTVWTHPKYVATGKKELSVSDSWTPDTAQ